MGTITNSIFSGNSRYSTDFQAVIDRAAAIASMPVTLLQTQKASLNDQTTALTGLGDAFSKLQAAVDGIAESLGGSSFQADISDPEKLSVTLGNGAVEGNYTVEVLHAGAYASSMSVAKWVAAAGPPHSYKLSIGGKEYAVNAADNTAAGVAAAINNQYSDKVRAVVVNVGTTELPDSRISLQAVTLGDLRPDLLDGSTSLQSQQTTGVEANYIVNGSGLAVYSKSQSISIADGVTVRLKDKGPGAPVNITVTRSSSAVSDALQAFATAYNGAVDELDKQHGQTSGVLAGQSMVGQLSQVLSGIATYSSTDSQVGSLAGLGLDLDKAGHMTFNMLTFIAADLTGSSGVTSFLGSTTQGFLKWANDGLSGIEQAGTGLLPLAQDSVKAESTRLDNSIAEQQGLVARMKVQMQERMAAVDALVASMEQQYNYLSGMFQAMQTSSSQYK
jgi:flagellar capping protein FliD